jgi:uncharacterized protein (DUF1015 family)
MKINQFKLISFDSKYWKSEDFSLFLDNSDTKDKIIKTTKIMEFLKTKIAIGEAKIDATPGMYILKFSNNSKCVISLIAKASYDEKSIFVPNENIHPNKLLAYKKIFDRYKMQINPILTFYEGGKSIREITAPYMQNHPKIETHINGSQYSLWKIENPVDWQYLKEELLFINKLYIADGHHRYSVFSEALTKNTEIMIAITDAQSIILTSCHRVIMQNIDPFWKDKIAKYCTLEKLDMDPDRVNATLIKLRTGETYRAIFKYKIHENTSFHESIENDIIRSSFGVIDMTNKVFPLPGSLNPKNSRNIFELYDNSSVIVFIPNIEIYEFLNTVRNGKKLPPTSTWFEPKIIDGFATMKLQQ